jgi:hypothetical protein
MEAAVLFSDGLQGNPEVHGIHGAILALKRLILMPARAGLFMGGLVEGLIKGHGSRRTQELFGDTPTRLKHEALLQLRCPI